jgi:hypothetical protein
MAENQIVMAVVVVVSGGGGGGGDGGGDGGWTNRWRRTVFCLLWACAKTATTRALVPTITHVVRHCGAVNTHDGRVLFKTVLLTEPATSVLSA